MVAAGNDPSPFRERDPFHLEKPSFHGGAAPESAQRSSLSNGPVAGDDERKRVSRESGPRGARGPRMADTRRYAPVRAHGAARDAVLRPKDRALERAAPVEIDDGEVEDDVGPRAKRPQARRELVDTGAGFRT
jgi:hypothetical protein